MNRLYSGKIAPELLSAVHICGEKESVDCIIYARDYINLRRLLDKKKFEYREYPFISALGVSLRQSDVIGLAKSKSTCFITKQTRVFAQVNRAGKIMEVDNFYNRGIYGQDVTVCIIDTGISSHLDFCLGENRIIHFVDLINHKKMPYDDNGHGTFVASIACGSGFVSAGKYKGMAPKSKIISIKAIEKNGETGAYKILEAMQWIAENHRKYNIRVVCMSFGSNPLGQNDPLIAGASALWNMGIVVVAAAGNSGPEEETIKSPGFNHRIITVGGMDDGRSGEEYHIAPFSSRGPAGLFFKPDIVAPSVDIVGADIISRKGQFYTMMSGTSVATPMISGICALIISYAPSLTPDMVKTRLLSICQNITQDRNEEGYGYPLLGRFFR